MAGQNEIIGFGAEQAQVIVGGAVGAGLRLYLRPAGSLIGAVMTGALCISSASVFAPPLQPMLQKWVPLNASGCGAVVALLTLTVAALTLRAIERFDFGALIKRRVE